MTLDQLKVIIQREAPSTGLPWELVYAVCVAESSGREFAIKCEPQYKYLVGESLSVGERWGQKHSWGLMQVMGGVAREWGFTGPFTDLWIPEVGVHYGMKHLKRFYDKHKNWPDTIASYNAGRPVRVDGRYVNQDYVDKVLKLWNEVEHAVPLKSTEV